MKTTYEKECCRGCGLVMDERSRFDGKFNRLFRRMEKLIEDLVKSGLILEDKAELWEVFGSFCSGMAAAFERDHPELKGEQTSKRPKAKRSRKHE